MKGKNTPYQQARMEGSHYRYLHTGEPQTGIISKLELQQGTTTTHFLESQGEA